ncbi:MAG: hypothetical protein AB1716_04635, partial [Planctomycetota bacterium]
MRISMLLSLAVLLATGLAAGPARAGQEGAPLARYVPADVFLYIEGRHNPERAFVERYWGEVFA